MAHTLYQPQSFRGTWAQRLAWRMPVAVIAASGLMALCAHISIPLGFTPVPLTMQTFGVLLIGLLLPPGAAFASLALYLIEGAAGLPVLSPAAGGSSFLHLFGPTGGYLLCYPFAAALASTIYRYACRGILAALAASFMGSALILVLGAIWFGVFFRTHFSLLLGQSVTPFLLGDALKAAAAAGCASLFDFLRGSSRAQTSASTEI
jgi:biotin transport system substrate-specific component